MEGVPTNIEDYRITPGDYITVEKWTSHEDNSYTDCVLLVHAVDQDLIHTEVVVGHGRGLKPTLSTSRCVVRKVNPEFVDAAIAI